MGTPTIKPATTTAHWMFLIPKLDIRWEVILCAAPLSATSFPSIAPKPSISTKNPSVSPIPFWIDSTIFSNSIPWNNPTNMHTVIKEIKALSLNLAIKINNNILILCDNNVDKNKLL